MWSVGQWVTVSAVRCNRQQHNRFVCLLIYVDLDDPAPEMYSLFIAHGVTVTVTVAAVPALSFPPTYYSL